MGSPLAKGFPGGFGGGEAGLVEPGFGSATSGGGGNKLGDSFGGIGVELTHKIVDVGCM